jgi:hypothetical protein
MNKEIKKKLQAEVVWTYTRSGAFQRAKIYRPNTNDEKKDSFRKQTKEFLFNEVFKKFAGKSITEKRLLRIVDDLVSLHNKKIFLRGSKLRFGNAQKFINLYLKGMWISGYIKRPPHFPVDRIMIIELGMKLNWTNMNKLQYQNVISKAKEKLKKETKYNSTAEWEAIEYLLTYIDREN